MASTIPNSSDIGDISGGAVTGYPENGAMWNINMIVFRVDQIASVVFIKSRYGLEQPISVHKIARAYAGFVLSD